jgi:hypothetical protein
MLASSWSDREASRFTIDDDNGQEYCRKLSIRIVEGTIPSDYVNDLHPPYVGSVLKKYLMRMDGPQNRKLHLCGLCSLIKTQLSSKQLQK